MKLTNLIDGVAVAITWLAFVALGFCVGDLFLDNYRIE